MKTAKQFIEKFNQRAFEIGYAIKIVGTSEKDGDTIFALTTNAPDLSMLYSCKNKKEFVQVICGNHKTSAIYCLLAYSTAVDVILSCDQDKRNGYLEKLGLFNGQAARKNKNVVNVKNYELKTRMNIPAKGMSSFYITEK